MIQTDGAISRLRRDLAISFWLKAALLTAILLPLVAQPLMSLYSVNRSVVVVSAGIMWIILSYRSARGLRLAAASPGLIAAGDLEQAELYIEQALRGFSLFSAVKLRSLYHLAVLRQMQRRWHDAAALSAAVLRHRLGAMSDLAQSSRLVLANSLLEVGDVHGAYEALTWLYAQRLTLNQALELNLFQADYLWRIGAWEQMTAGLTRKVEMAELMPTAKSALLQAMLALACQQTGRHDWAIWLTRRVELLAAPADLVEQRPVLRQLWPTDVASLSPKLPSDDSAQQGSAGEDPGQGNRLDKPHEASGEPDSSNETGPLR